MKLNEMCKNYEKVEGENKCKNFLGYKVITIDKVYYEEKYVIRESCKCRCALGKEIK
ncbi:hypothetical protein [Intestinibacter sp.]|uniref:hypothetical protein n=1 Tax=Intestinibacter sp. TaxID=1965304 RepID=UPI002A74AB04|nr:hypothetical protein [Intestinibacter sp.]MDY2734515.1 hypothetical protein [Intestinibacter sp.]